MGKPKTEQENADPYATPRSFALHLGRRFPPQSGQSTKSLVLSLAALLATGLSLLTAPLTGGIIVNFGFLLAVSLAIPAWFIGIRALIQRDRNLKHAWIGIALSSPYIVILGWILVTFIEMTLMLSAIRDR